MTSVILMLSPILALQAAGAAPMAVENDAPETWTLEYPRLIQPYVDDYRRCLTGQKRDISGVPDFEIQHRSDIVACEDVSTQSQEAANQLLAGKTQYSDYQPDDIREVFEHIGRIHIARGADLDNQFSFTIRAMQANESQFAEDRERQGLVLELRDASVVKARTDSTAAAAEDDYQDLLDEQARRQAAAELASQQESSSVND